MSHFQRLRSHFIPILFMSWLCSCSPHSTTPLLPPKGPDGRLLSETAAKGQIIYQRLCISCHNINPTQDGSVGPAIAGSSRALLEARILHGTYPPGYHPKRLSQGMPQFPLSASEIDSLSAFLTPLAK